jgi:DNA-binding NtrC family response regulator
MTARVLVVDDEPDVEPLFRQQFRREIRDGLYGLDFALSGETTLDMLDDHVGEEIILLVADINMPGMSGLDLLPIVKRCRPDLPVFMISAYGDADTVTTARKRGADKFLTKPVDFAKLRGDIMTVKADAMRRDA